jgi:hypothetical protein
MQAPTSTSWRTRVLTITALVSAAALAACGPAAPPVAVSSAASSAPVPPANPELQQLQTLPSPKDLKWDLAEGVTVAAASDPAKGDNLSSIQITPTGASGMHRVGVEGDFGSDPKTYHITLWLKPVGPTDATIDARGRTLINSALPADYGRAFFDLGKVAVAPNKLMTDDNKFKTLSITTDGDWKKISADMTTRDGGLYFSVGMVSKGSHVFTGAPGMGLIIGGITVTPAA